MMIRETPIRAGALLLTAGLISAAASLGWATPPSAGVWPAQFASATLGSCDPAVPGSVKYSVTLAREAGVTTYGSGLVPIHYSIGKYVSSGGACVFDSFENRYLDQDSYWRLALDGSSAALRAPSKYGDIDLEWTRAQPLPIPYYRYAIPDSPTLLDPPGRQFDYAGIYYPALVTGSVGTETNVLSASLIPLVVLVVTSGNVY